MSGAFVLAGTRVPAEIHPQHLAAGDSLDKFLDDLPSVRREQAVAYLECTLHHVEANTEQSEGRLCPPQTSLCTTHRRGLGSPLRRGPRLTRLLVMVTCPRSVVRWKSPPSSTEKTRATVSAVALSPAATGALHTDSTTSPLKHCAGDHYPLARRWDCAVLLYANFWSAMPFTTMFVALYPHATAPIRYSTI